ncbi:MAG: glycosyltransferase [Chloroflexi bacterium]|nr:glycosyltransferase [Chloroflexota bacterium]
MNKNANKKTTISMSEFRGILLVVLGSAVLGFYYQWWFVNDIDPSPWLIVTFVVALIYGMVQLMGNWILYLATHYRNTTPLPAAPDLTVDVYVTACGESPKLVERALAAAYNMRGEHRTWLLDDSDSPALKAVAQQVGAGYLTRVGNKDAKAGNLNAALARTDGDIVVIFDIDHAPNPDFLERTLGHFADEKIGFVQVMLTFENDNDGWVAQAAADSSLDFYNPTSIGTDGLGSATLIGSNALIRRTALDSISGYKPGLAEDLATSIAIHAEGWQSVYVPEPLAPGYAPPDLVAWFTQQLKWARGVFDLLLTDYPRYFRRLQMGQKISYGVRMTYYWIGPIAALHLLATVYTLWKGSAESLANYNQYLVHLAPIGVMTALIRQLALRKWRHSSLKAGAQGKPMALVYATWPTYAIAWVMALLRVPLGFKATPKTSSGGLNPLWLLPQTIMLLMLSGGLVYTMVATGTAVPFYVLMFTVAQIVAHSILITQWLQTILHNRLQARRQARQGVLQNLIPDMEWSKPQHTKAS